MRSKEHALLAPFGKNTPCLHLCRRRYEQGCSRLDFADIVYGHIEHCLNHPPLGCHNHHFVVDIIKCRTDSVRVAQHKRRTRTVTPHIRHIRRRDSEPPQQHIREVDFGFDTVRELGVAERVAILAVQAVVFLIQGIAKLFENKGMCRN